MYVSYLYVAVRFEDEDVWYTECKPVVFKPEVRTGEYEELRLKIESSDYYQKLFWKYKVNNQFKPIVIAGFNPVLTDTIERFKIIFPEINLENYGDLNA